MRLLILKDLQEKWIYLRDGWIGADLYVKPTDTHQFLHIDSCHPVHCKYAIPYCQALRLRRICSDEEHLCTRSTDLKNHLFKRGYNEQHVDHEIQWALSWEACLQIKNDRDKSARTPLVVTHHPVLQSLRSTTWQYQPILHALEQLKQAFPLPPLIAFRRPKNLRDLLVKATLITTQQDAPGNYRCESGRCKTCPILSTTDAFASHTTGERFKISITASCKSFSVVYLITCKRCGQQYVGKTGQPLHLRMNGHHHDTAHKRTEDSPLALTSTTAHTL